MAVFILTLILKYSFSLCYESSNTKVSWIDEVPILANVDENVVELKGEAVKVFKALQYVVQHLRKFLVHHSVLPLFVKRVSLPLSTCMAL